MRRVLAIALAILLLLLPSVRAQEDIRDPGFVNGIMRVLVSPQVVPGEAGEFVFNLSNPYGHPMQNISLNVSIYQYVTIEESVPVDGSWAWTFPRIRNAAVNPREYKVEQGGPSSYLGNTSGSNYKIERFTIETSVDMPHGSVFAQAAYFLRFWLEFDINNGTQSHIVMASRGYFTSQQWEAAHVSDPPDPNCNNAVNTTYRCLGLLNLTRLNVDGILADSSFGVKEPFPAWPFYGLLGVTGFFLVLAFLFWVEENPGQYPRVERTWLRFKGRLRRLVRRPGAGKI